MVFLSIVFLHRVFLIEPLLQQTHSFNHKIGKNIALIGNGSRLQTFDSFTSGQLFPSLSLNCVGASLRWSSYLSSFGRSVGRQLLAAPPSDIPVAGSGHKHYTYSGVYQNLSIVL